MFGGFLEQAYRGATTLTFGGGVNEIQRDIIAMAGLAAAAESEIAMLERAELEAKLKTLRRQGDRTAVGRRPTSSTRR